MNQRYATAVTIAVLASIFFSTYGAHILGGLFR